ncbi:lipase family protein, partial [Nocardia veterana]|uniref:lipase family protein n=1 Tax=Nocardia veterana TaxID=132249 RepID=UPI000593338C
AVLDSARAAQQLPNNGVGPRPPIVIYGYSQGGMASAGAAELQPSYAPELNVRGAYIGGPVVDPEYFLGFNEGQPSLSGATGFMLNGIAADYPDTRPVLDAELNDAGKALLRDAADKCAIAVAIGNPQRQTSQFTASGEPLTAVIDRSPALKQAFDEQRIGGGTPSAPVLIAAAKNDEGAPYGPIRDVAAAWCSRGVPVQLDANAQLPSVSGVVGTHDLAFFPSLAASQMWLTDRLAAAPAPANCGALP